MATITAEQYMPANERSFDASGHGDMTSNVSPVSSLKSTQTMDDVLNMLRQTNGAVTNVILWDLINDNAVRREHMISLYGRYCGDPAYVPIKTRKLANPNKVNNRLANDYFGDIIDTKVGYFGTGIGVDLSADVYKNDAGDLDEQAFHDADAVIQDYRELTNAEDVESEVISMQAICGIGVKLLYVRENDPAPRQMSSAPWEWIFIYDESIAEPQYAMRYYKVLLKEIKGNGTAESRERWRVEWYDAKRITFFLEDEKKHFFPDGNESLNPIAHMFDGIPVVAFPNNEQMMGDCEKVIDLIDAIDRTDSDVNSEIEQLRLAYMYLKGAGLNLDQHLVDQMKQTGVIPLSEDGEVGFVTKTLDDSVIMNHLTRVERNIMRFAKSVDFGDNSFSGQLPVIAYKIKIAGLEHKCKKAELKTRTALRYEYTLLARLWKVTGTADIDPLDINFTFTRNLPANLEGEMNVLRQGSGLVSQKTLFSLMSFIKDPEEEIRRMEEEKQQDAVNLDAIPPGMQELMNAQGSFGPGEAGTAGNQQDSGQGGEGIAPRVSESFG